MTEKLKSWQKLAQARDDISRVKEKIALLLPNEPSIIQDITHADSCLREVIKELDPSGDRFSKYETPVRRSETSLR